MRVHLTRAAASGYLTGRFDRDDVAELLAGPQCTSVEIVLVEIDHRFQVTMSGVEAISVTGGRS